MKVTIFAKSVDLAHGYRRTRQPDGTPIHDAGDLHQIDRCTIHLVGEYWRILEKSTVERCLGDDTAKEVFNNGGYMLFLVCLCLLCMTLVMMDKWGGL